MADRELLTEVKVINLQPGLARNLKANLNKISIIRIARNLDSLKDQFNKKSMDNFGIIGIIFFL